LAESIGCKTIDLSKLSGGSNDASSIREAILQLLPPWKNGAHDVVDASIDCVGYEAWSAGREGDREEKAAQMRHLALTRKWL
jgi:hypothetical protein